MDYEKKYKEALENMRKLRDSLMNNDEPETNLWVLRKDIIKDIEYYFPELKESEDEKIRKEIIAHVKYLKHKGPLNATELDKYSSWLAWLEKQGEQKISYDTCDSSMTDNKKSPYGEKRDFGYFEEKPAEWEQENCNDLTEFENAMMHIGSSFFGEHAGLDPNDTNAIKEQANLLAELVAKQEWSEEDEKMWKSALWHVKNSCGNGGKNSGEFDVYNWLKSLGPQKQWKPSEEQIRDLVAAISCVTDDFSENPTLSERLHVLLEQLKKLTE